MELFQTTMKAEGGAALEDQRNTCQKLKEGRQDRQSDY